MKKKTFPITNIGSVSLIMIFIVLCLVTFATLSLSGAASDYRYSEKTARHNTEYYEASNKAAYRLKDIDFILQSTYKEQPAGYIHAVSLKLTSLSGLDTDFTKEEPAVTFREKLNNAQALEVSLALHQPGKFKDGYYRIIAWQVVNTGSWESDQSLQLIK